LDKNTESFSRYNTRAIFEQLEVEEYKHGEGYSEELIIDFLAGFMSASVYKIMDDNRRTPPASLGETKMSELEVLLRLRERIQQAVSAGFQGAIQTYSGNKIEYYCQIYPVPEAPTKVLQ
jgi:hypothetical protein